MILSIVVKASLVLLQLLWNEHSFFPNHWMHHRLPCCLLSATSGCVMHVLFAAVQVWVCVVCLMHVFIRLDRGWSVRQNHHICLGTPCTLAKGLKSEENVHPAAKVVGYFHHRAGHTQICVRSSHNANKGKYSGTMNSKLHKEFAQCEQGKIGMCA